MSDRSYRTFLSVWRFVPRGVRRHLVRWGSPWYTVGAISVIERADGAILLVKHVYRPSWGLPGGLLNRREDAVMATRREALEEVGLAIELMGEPAVVVSPKVQRVDLVFRARPLRPTDVESVRPSSPEIEQVRWFAPDALPDLQTETATALVALARSSAAPQAAPLPSTER